MSLQNKHVLLAISSGIAAYKTPQLVRDLRRAGAQVRVILTDNAAKLVSPLALQAVSDSAVQSSLWDAEMGTGMDHIELARWADIFLVAPATANTLAKLVHGAADDLLTTVALATKARLCVAPAMNAQMWVHPATHANIELLAGRGVAILGPEAGEQACGDIGMGRMREPLDLVADLEALANTNDSLQGQHWVITAGPTQERLDPVRYITNHSTGEMGFALATEAARQGAKVTLICGPVNQITPLGVVRIDVITAKEMAQHARSQAVNADVFIGAAAVADYTPIAVSKNKIKKQAQSLSLDLERTEDIIASVAALQNKPCLIGFAAETEQVIAYAQDKRRRKNLDAIIANQVGEGAGFGAVAPCVHWISEGVEELLQAPSKRALAPKIMALIHELRLQS